MRRLKYACWLCLAGLSLTGCLPTPDGTNFYLSSADEAQSRKSCERLNRIGDFRGLSDRIRRDTEYVKGLIRRGQVNEQVLGYVRQAGDRIKKNSAELVRMVGPEFSGINQQQRLVWDLDWQSLGLKQSDWGSWQIEEAKITSIHNWQGSEPDLGRSTVFRFGPKNILAQFQRPASSLEICQLQQTIVITIEVKLRSHMNRTRTMNYTLLAKNAPEQ